LKPSLEICPAPYFSFDMKQASWANRFHKLSSSQEHPSKLLFIPIAHYPARRSDYLHQTLCPRRSLTESAYVGFAAIVGNEPTGQLAGTVQVDGQDNPTGQVMADHKPSTPQHLRHFIDGSPIFRDIDMKAVEAGKILIALYDPELRVRYATD
jgi:hypothetical protein